MSDPTPNGPPASGVESGLNLVDAVMAETIGIAMHNAVAAQNNMRMMGAAAVTAACVRMIKASGGPLPPIVPVPTRGHPTAAPGGVDETGGNAGEDCTGQSLRHLGP